MVGDYYASYSHSFRQIPLNDVASVTSSSVSVGRYDSDLPVTLFIATVAAFLIIVVTFPVVVWRLFKGTVMNLYISNKCTLSKMTIYSVIYIF